MPSSTPSVRVYGGRPVHERQQERRERLLQAGLQLFGTVGFRGTSVRAVLAHAQLSERYFGESFDSLRSLFQDVYDEAVNEVTQKTFAAVAAVAEANGGPEAEIRAGLDALFRSISADRRYARIILIEVLAVGPSFFGHGLAKFDVFSVFVATRAAEIGLSAEPLSMHTLASGMVGSASELLRKSIYGPGELPVDDAVDHAVFIFEAALLKLRNAQ